MVLRFVNILFKLFILETYGYIKIGKTFMVNGKNIYEMNVQLCGYWIVIIIYLK